MAEDPLAQAEEPMLRSASQDGLPKPQHRRRDWRSRLAIFSPLASPAGQICLAYLIYILGPGVYWNIFSAIPAFQSTVTTALVFTRDNVRAAEYALPSVVGFVSGILINKLGPKYTLLVGCIGYPLKIAAYLSNDGLYRRCYVGPEDCYSRFEEFAGILLAFCQGLSGSVVPYLMLVYPAANSKGLAVAGFLGLWSLSALIGAAIKFFSIRESTALAYYSYFYADTQTAAVWYAPFLVLAVVATCLCLLIVHVERGRGSSGSSKTSRGERTWWRLAVELGRDVLGNPYMLSLLPMFFVSTWFYGYQFAKANSGIQFTLRAQALNLILYWSTSTAASLVIGVTLDTARTRRRTRARLAWLALLLLTIPIWSGGSVFQAQNDAYENNFLTSSGYPDPLDPGRKAYWSQGAVLFLAYGLHSAAWQVVSYWIFGALTDDPHRLANYAGVYNAAQSAGNAVIWRLVSPGAYVVGFEYASNRSVFDAVWALAIASLLIAAPTFFSGVRDVAPPDQRHFDSSSTTEGESEAAALPVEDAVIETTSSAVALPRDGALQTHKKTRLSVSNTTACISYLLIGVIVLLPIVLATLGTLVNTGGSDGCLPDGTFAIPGNFDIWDPQYVLTLTVGFGRMTFPLAKLLDLSWDIIIGHGGQGLLIWLAYRVLSRYLVCLLEHEGVTMRTYTAVSFRTGSLEGAWLLARDLARRKKSAVPRGLAMMLYIAIYLLVFPAVISAMTSYAAIGDAFVTFETPSAEDPALNTTVTRSFSDFRLVNQTDGTWTFHNVTNLTTAFILEKAHCTPTNYYRWGFSYLLLFVLAVASSVFTVLLVLLQQHDGIASSVQQSGRHTPGLWRSVMEMSSHARSIVSDGDPEHLSMEKLELELKNTRMAFDKEGLDEVWSALAAADATSDVVHDAANQADRDEKTGWIYRAEAVFRRRKRSKGVGGYESPLAQYEGV